MLVVDDHAVVRRGLRAFFESEPDLEVVGAADGGAQALDLLEGLDAEGRRPDVVVMDLQMRPLNGIESTRLIRARYDDVEVVVLTSYADDELVRGALEAGASGYVLKDADADEVAAAVRAADRGELQLDPAVARRLLSSLGATSRGEATAQLTDARGRGPAAGRGGQGQQGDRRPARHQRTDGPHARLEHPGQAGPRVAHAGRAVGGARGPGGGRHGLTIARAFHPVRAMLRRTLAVPTIEQLLRISAREGAVT